VADGLTDELIDLLSMARGLRVRSRGTVMRYRGGDRDPREIGRELRVCVVVEGSVRRDAGHVRVTVRLVSVADGVQIWHRRFDRPETEIFAVGDAAARAISEALAAPLSAPQRAAPQDAEAIDLYLRARSLYLRFFADLKGESAQLFEQALAIAPDDPRILAGYALASARFWTGRGEQTEKTRRAAETAVERAPNLPESHVALATVRYKQRAYPQAVSALRRALQISELNAEAHDLMGRLLSETTLQDAARMHLEAALKLEPEFHLPRSMLSRWYMLRGEWEAAEAVFEESGVIRTTSLASVGRLCLWKRDVERARRLLQENAGRTDPSWHLVRLLLDTVANRTPPFQRRPPLTEVTPQFYAFVCQLEAEGAMYLGDVPGALAAIEEADAQVVFDVAWADGCPLFEPLRGEPRFQAARDRIAERARSVEEAYRRLEA
jgi:eukaryotic-like serine/threonine-protein kinase